MEGALRLAVLVGGVGLLVACGSGNGDSSYADCNTYGTGASSGSSSSSNDGGDPLGSSGGTFQGTGDSGVPTSGNVAPSCATASATPKAIPVYLVFMFDRSGSMKDNSKWTSCAA